MKIVIAVASANAALRTFVVTNRNLVVPPEIIARGYLKDKGARFSVQVLEISAQTTRDDLGLWLRKITGGAEGAILLIDEVHRHLAGDLEDAYFVASLQAYPGRVLQNQFRSAITPVLKHFVAYSQRFDNLGAQRVLLLPMDIFRANELVALRVRLTTLKMVAGLAHDLDQIISALQERARPKSRQRFRKVYLVDDRPLWYRYGPDRHAVIQTIKPPHDEKCWHLSRYRFGRLYDDGLHHNVDDDSKPTKVLGTFNTCHGDTFTASGESHLNIFPNGYI